MNDFSLMTFGKYKGITLVNVPAKYLLWLYEQGDIKKDLKKYIEDNMDVLKKEIKDGK